MQDLMFQVVRVLRALRRVRVLRGPQGEEIVMSFESAVIFLIAMLLLVYLTVALLKPEKF
jgi:K+-transporting ATPase KdpF subunit